MKKVMIIILFSDGVNGGTETRIKKCESASI